MCAQSEEPKLRQPRLPLPKGQPNPALKGTRGYALVFFPYSARPRPLARALGILLSMSQEIANAVKADFERLTNLSVSVTYMPKGSTHQPTSLQTGSCGVYVLMSEEHCFKVGKAGTKSKARWNSHHYNLDDTTPSTLPKSIIRDKEKFKRFFAKEFHPGIDALSKSNVQDLIKNNLYRIEFLMKDNDDKFALNLLEALAQFHLKPVFEGRNA